MRYRAKAPLFVRKLILAGEEFESDLPPGRNWHPLDDEAKAAVEKYRSGQGKVLELYNKRDPAPIDPNVIDIPDDWKSLPQQKRRGLAMKFGAQSNVKADNADSFITAELERRRQRVA